MSAEENKAIVQRLTDEVFNENNWDALNEIIASDFVDHAAHPDQDPGPESFKQNLINVREAFPDYHTTNEDLIAEGDKVVARWTARGTHQGKFIGVEGEVPPTGDQVTVSGTTTYKVANGKLVEQWAHWDHLGMLQQLGSIKGGSSS